MILFGNDDISVTSNKIVNHIKEPNDNEFEINKT